MQSDMTLYHDPKGMASQAARLILAENGAACRLHVVSAGFSSAHLHPKFAAINPAMTLPVLVSAGRPVCALNEISDEIAGAVPDLSADQRRWVWSAADYWDSLLAVGLVKPWMQGAARFELRRRMQLARRYARKNPGLASEYENKISEFQRLEAAVGDEEKTQARLRRLDELFNRFEKHIAGRAFVFGDSWSAADAAWTAFIARLRALGLRDIVNRTRHPATSVYFNAMKRRPSFAAAGVRDARILLGLSLSQTSTPFTSAQFNAAPFSTPTLDQRSAS